MEAERGRPTRSFITIMLTMLSMFVFIFKNDMKSNFNDSYIISSVLICV